MGCGYIDKSGALDVVCVCSLLSESINREFSIACWPIKIESLIYSMYTYIVFSFHYTHFNVIFGWMPNQAPLFGEIAYAQIVNDISENR